jgi:predicted  nucleic acid-binding Zn-ribbon protein
MSNKIIDSIKHAIIEDDDPKPDSKSQPYPQASSGSAPAVTTTSNAPRPAMGAPPMSEEVEHVYQRILAKTNFDSTQIAATIHKYLDPLVAIPSLDERTRFKTAVVQAKAQEGLTQEKILATFDGLKVALRNEQESFTASAQTTKEREIADRQKRVQEATDEIARKQSEIAQLQQHLTEMTSELLGAQSKIQRAETQFAAAVQRRVAEIDQEKAKYASLLQG